MIAAHKEKSAQVHTIIETVISALEAVGASHQTALHLLAMGAICRMKDLDQLKQMRMEVNSAIICNDDTIGDDTCVIVGECTCIVQYPEPNELN